MGTGRLVSEVLPSRDAFVSFGSFLQLLVMPDLGAPATWSSLFYLRGFYEQGSVVGAEAEAGFDARVLVL